jgi:hypothetical protein
MKTLIYRRNNTFIINEDKLSVNANTTPIKNALYAAIYDEFKGASVNPKYKKLTPLKRMQKLNDFAANWLTERKL